MKNVKIEEIVNATGGRLLCGNPFDEVRDLNIDSRKIEEGVLFVPIIGARVDSHKYIPDAMKVTNATLTDRELDEYEEGKSYILVDNTELALRRIGRYIRTKYKRPVVGVTGSVGKTTTREMITTALLANVPVYHTEGNLNSQIGVPITLSRMCDRDSEVAVLELGISEEGHMESLTDMAKPDIAVVTMIGVAHIEFMKTRENICRQKLLIAGDMDENGVIFLNGDDELLKNAKVNDKVKTFYYGTSEGCDYRAENIHLEDGFNTYDYVHGEDRIKVKLSAMGRHNVLNSLVGIAIADYMGYDIRKSAEAFSSFKGLRQKVFESKKGYIIIDDTYNASPDSMKASLNVLSDIECSGKRYAVLGDMYELGDNSVKYHREVGEYVKDTKTDILVAVGELAEDIADACDKEKVSVLFFKDKEAAAEYLNENLKPEDVILVKASNGMKLSELVEKLN